MLALKTKLIVTVFLLLATFSRSQAIVQGEKRVMLLRHLLHVDIGHTDGVSLTKSEGLLLASRLGLYVRLGQCRHPVERARERSLREKG